MGIALGIAIHFVIAASTLALFLAKRAGWEIFEGNLGYLLQALLASIIACGCCYGVYASNIEGTVGIGTTWIAGPVGGLAYFLGLLVLGNPEAKQILQFARMRLAHRSG